ncbi:MAG: hypothetical protein WD847_01745 [Pirellulales bacterium]
MPAIASPKPSAGAETPLCCLRCGTPLRGEAATPDCDSQPAADGFSTASPLLELDGWELEEQLRHVERVLAGPAGASSGLPATGLRADGAKPHVTPCRPGLLVTLLAWIGLAAGLATLACGSVLSTWGVVAARDDLWRIGMPVALIGQFALLAGLVLHSAGLSPPAPQVTRS